MANELAEWKVRAYARNVHLLASQAESTLMGMTREESDNGAAIAFDRLAPFEGNSPSSRFAPTPTIMPSHSRRWCYPTPWNLGVLMDNFERAQQIHEPTNQYTIQMTGAYGREWDRRCITALLGSAVEGAGETGSPLTTVAYDTTNQRIVHGSAALTKAKIIRARAMLDTATNSNRAMYGPYCIVYHPDDGRTILQDTAWTSVDFMAMQPLMEGKPLTNFMGFRWIPNTLLPNVSNIRSCIAFAKAGVGMGRNPQARRERTDERADLSYALQVYMEDQFNFVRIDDKLVVEVQVDTTTIT